MEKINMKNSSLRYNIDRVIKEKIIHSIKSDKYGNKVSYYNKKINFFVISEISRIVNRATFDDLLGVNIRDKFKT